MAQWIATNAMGWDLNSIGFESIQGCTGLVVETDHWIAGLHFGGASQGMLGPATAKGVNFMNFLRAIPGNPWPNAGIIAGNIKLWNIHNNHLSAGTELQEFAVLLGCNGGLPTVEAFMFNLRRNIGATDSAHVIVNRRPGQQAEVQFKRTSKMGPAAGPAPIPGRHQMAMNNANIGSTEYGLTTGTMMHNATGTRVHIT
jgi:hypothetical protein